MADRMYYHVDRGPGSRYVLSKSGSRSKDITKRGYHEQLAIVKSLKQLIHMAKIMDRRAQAAVARYANTLTSEDMTNDEIREVLLMQDYPEFK